MFRRLIRGLAELYRLALAFSRRRAQLHGVAVGIALALGMWGWSLKLAPESTGDWLDVVFRTMQLITLQFPTSLDHSIPWQLQLSRLLVPAAAFFATFHLMVGALTNPLKYALLPRTSGHVIVFGASHLSEAAIKGLAARRDVLAVTGAGNLAERQAMEEKGLIAVEGGPSHPSILPVLNAKSAAAILILGSDDMTNINMLMAALGSAKDRAANLDPLIVAMKIEREDLAREVDAALDRISRESHSRYRRISPARENLRAKLLRYAPALTKAEPTSGSHILIFGLNGQWEHAIWQIFAVGQDHPTRLPRLTFVLTEEERQAFAAWTSAIPDLQLVAEIEVVAASRNGLPSDEGSRFADAPPDLVVVLREDFSLVTALALRRPGNARWGKAPIIFQQKIEDYFLRNLADARVDDRDFSNLVSFNSLITADAIDRTLNTKEEELPKVLHEHYVKSLSPEDNRETLAVKDWNDLPENLREANRAVASHLPILFASIGLAMEKNPQSGTPRTLSDEEIELLAQVSHRRWSVDRLERGWRWGTVRDDARFLHPSLRSYDQLSPGERRKAREGVMAIVQSLTGAGVSLRPARSSDAPEKRQS